MVSGNCQLVRTEAHVGRKRAPVRDCCLRLVCVCVYQGIVLIALSGIGRCVVQECGGRKTFWSSDCLLFSFPGRFVHPCCSCFFPLLMPEELLWLLTWTEDQFFSRLPPGLSVRLGFTEAPVSWHHNHRVLFLDYSNHFRVCKALQKPLFPGIPQRSLLSS